jgi:hypothetical protein
MGIKTNSDSDLVRVLKNDGVDHSELLKYENCSTVNLSLNLEKIWVWAHGQFESLTMNFLAVL